jgi:hypothetical protein
MIAALPYLLALSGGAYLAGIGMTIAGKWPPAARLPWWLVILAIVAFTLDRVYPDVAYVAAPILLVTVAAILVRIATAPRILRPRGLLWMVFLIVPVIVIAIAAIGDFLPTSDARVITFCAGSLLALPGLGAVVLGALRLTAYPSRRRDLKAS